MSKHFEVDLHQQIWTILHTHFSIQTHSFCLQFAIICLQIFFCRLFRQIKTYNHLTEITTTKLNANSSNQNVVCRPIANMPRLSFSFTLQRRCKFDSTTCTLNQCICFLRMLSSIVSLFCISYLNLESRQNRTNLPTQNRYGIISFFSTFLFDYFCFVVIALV